MLTPSGEEESTHESSRVVRLEAQAWRGPLPPPEQLQQYEVVVPGAGDRILRMAEEEQRHRLDRQQSVLDLASVAQSQAFKLRTLGVLLTVLFVVAGTTLTVQGQATGGLTLLGGTGIMFLLVTVASAVREQRRLSRREQLTPPNPKNPS